VEDRGAIHGYAGALPSFPTSRLHQRPPSTTASICVPSSARLVDPVTFTVAIGLFWYWVGMNIVSWRERRAAYLFSWRPLQLLADVLAIGVGLFWIGVCWNEIRHPNERLFSVQDWLWYALLFGLPILWGIVLISFFGYDCIHSFVTRRKSA
jgi:hypothetical protein